MSPVPQRSPDTMPAPAPSAMVHSLPSSMRGPALRHGHAAVPLVHLWRSTAQMLTQAVMLTCSTDSRLYALSARLQQRAEALSEDGAYGMWAGALHAALDLADEAFLIEQQARKLEPPHPHSAALRPHALENPMRLYVECADLLGSAAQRLIQTEAMALTDGPSAQAMTQEAAQDLLRAFVRASRACAHRGLADGPILDLGERPQEDAGEAPRPA